MTEVQRIRIDDTLIEYKWSRPRTSQVARVGQPPIVFLHHGFGCVADWYGFPEKISELTGLQALAYSRRGSGGSSPLPSPRDETYLHEEARVWLPALLDTLKIPRCYLYGHSDGASIALLFASAFRDRAIAVAVEAPHVFAEAATLRGVAALKHRFDVRPELFDRLSRFHRDPRSAVEEWARPWLSPAFAEWSIVAELTGLTMPLLVIQGGADPFGSMEHARLIEKHAHSVSILELPDCGHTPHFERAEKVTEEVAQFLRRAV